MERVHVILSLAFLAGLSSGSAHATTSIVKIVPTGVIFAADSKSINDTASGSRHHLSCKIIRPSKVNPRVWMTKAGIDRFSINGIDELDTKAIATSAISLHYDLYKGVVAFGNDLSMRLTYFLIAARPRFPALFSRLLPQDGSIVTEAAFAQVLPDGRVDVYEVRFVGHMRADRTRVHIEPVIVRKSTADGVVFLGYVDKIRSISGGQRLDLGSPESLRRAIDVEVHAHPDKVGPPIAILKLDRNGPHWIARGVC